jgi:hypothetical protein
LVRFGFRIWEILILKWILLLKIQINSKNRFWKEKSVEEVATLGPTAQATLVIHNIPFFSDANDLGIVGKSSHHLVQSGMEWSPCTLHPPFVSVLLEKGIIMNCEQ